jgi:hypothetical protein
MIVPMTLTAIGLLAGRSDRVGTMRWAAVGTLWGFVIATAWSLGFFYAPAAILLLASALVHVGAHSTHRDQSVRAS